MREPVFAIFNPQSGKGRGAGLVEPVLAALSAAGLTVTHRLSAAAGEEGALAEEAVARGFRRIVAVGGDGTWGNVGNALIRSRTEATLALVAGGTGCDLAKSLGVPATDLQACARIVRDGHTRTIDAGRIEERYFLNVAGFGFDIAVIEHSRRVRWLGGSPLYVYCALRQLSSFPGFTVEMAADGAAPTRHELMMLIVANARVFGGGFQIAPEADLGDGRFDAVAFRNMRPLRRLAMMGRLMKGTHVGTPEVTTTRCATLRLRFAGPPAYETDGEWNQARSAELVIESVPRALRVAVPA